VQFRCTARGWSMDRAKESNRTGRDLKPNSLMPPCGPWHNGLPLDAMCGAIEILAAEMLWDMLVDPILPDRFVLH